MISYIKGEFIIKNPAYVVIENNGIGYQINISLNTYSRIQNEKNGLLYTYYYLREDGTAHIPVLYGFADEAEKSLFTLLISVNGVGANTARVILSSISVKDLEQAILTDNDILIQKIKGVGPKTAKKIVLELKDKIGKIIQPGDSANFRQHNTVQGEALSALAMLGFSRQSAEKAIALAVKSNNNISSVEELVKTALKNL
ncbi:MAG: Holliday junction branch migration protein RuvA [Fimbriimonadaceae bacterium]|nr:Holliday junction branch migration protein RuvA [Chitinophagales bacterium]